MSGPVLNVPGHKVTLYLLNPLGKDPSKAKFFLGRGFTLVDWVALSDALATHAFNGWPGTVKQGNYGLKHVITGPMLCPNGTTPEVLTVWKIEPGNPGLSFVTAYKNS